MLKVFEIAGRKLVYERLRQVLRHPLHHVRVVPVEADHVFVSLESAKPDVRLHLLDRVEHRLVGDDLLVKTKLLDSALKPRASRQHVLQARALAGDLVRRGRGVVAIVRSDSRLRGTVHSER